MAEKTQQIIDELIVSYWMEMETIQNYIACSINLTGVRAEEIKKSLAADVTEEITHAQTLAKRIHILGGTVPGSMEFKASQNTLQPSSDPTDVVAVIQGVIDAENGAIDQYKKIIQITDGEDYVTQDMVIGLLASEEEHRREFMGFLTEYQKG